MRAGGLVDGDLQVGHFGVNLLRGQHVQPADEHRTFDHGGLRAVEAVELCMRGGVDARHVQHRALRVVVLPRQAQLDVAQGAGQAHTVDVLGALRRPRAAASHTAGEDAGVGQDVQDRRAGGNDVVVGGRWLERHQHHLVVAVAHTHRRDVRRAVRGDGGDDGFIDDVVHRVICLKSSVGSHHPHPSPLPQAGEGASVAGGPVGRQS